MTDYMSPLDARTWQAFRKLCIRGLRFTVYDVLSYLAAGMSIDEILSDFPMLTREDILGCLGYAADRERLTIVAKL